MGYTSAGLPGGGQTAHYQISYDDSLSAADGLTRAAQLMEACEQDFRLVEDWFGDIRFQFSLPISVEIANASGGASRDDPADISLPFGYNPTVTLKPGSGTTGDFIRYLLVSEVAEMFMASRNGNWFESARTFNGASEGSKGKGLSRFLGGQFKVASGQESVRYLAFEVVANWLNAPHRPNHVDDSPDDIDPAVVTGCTTCFLYYLHDQLGFDVPSIIRAGSGTLGGVYSSLTGKSDGWASFIALVDTFYPRGVTYNPAGDRIFPVARLSNLSDARIPAGASLNLRLLSLDTQALAEVVVGLASDDPTLLGVPARVPIAVGTWAGGFQLTAASVTGPAQSVAIHADYAGSTLSASVRILPRPGLLEGQVTDTDFAPLPGAMVLIQSDIEILPGGGHSLQLSTDADGFYQTPALPPHDYQVRAVQSGFVPGVAGVAVNEGVPVTTLNFALATTLPFDVVGSVSDQAGSPIAGATVTLVQNSPAPGQLHVVTNADGQYTVSMDPGPFDGAVTISAAMPGYVSSRVTLTIPNGATINEDFVLIALGSLSGATRDTGGTPIAGATVTAGTASTHSDDGGRYSLEALEPGATIVVATAAGFDAASATVMVGAGVDTVVNLALMPASAVITGTVTDADQGFAIFGATIRAGADWTHTGPDGTYRLSAVAAGRIDVTVAANHYHPDHAQVDVFDQQTFVQDFRLSNLRHRPGVPN